MASAYGGYESHGQPKGVSDPCPCCLTESQVCVTRSGQSWVGGPGPPALRSPEGLCCPAGAGWGRPPAGLSTFSWLAGPDARPAVPLHGCCTHSSWGWWFLPLHPAGVTPLTCLSCFHQGAVRRCAPATRSAPPQHWLWAEAGAAWGAVLLAMPKEPGVPPSPEQQLCGPWETLPGLGGCSVWKVARWQRQPGVLSV